MIHYGDILLTDEAPKVLIERAYPCCRREWLDPAAIGHQEVVRDADRVTCPGCLEFLAKRVVGALGGAEGKKVHARTYTAEPCMKDGTVAAGGGHLLIHYTTMCGRGGEKALSTNRSAEVTCLFCKESGANQPPWRDGQIVPLAEWAAVPTHRLMLRTMRTGTMPCTWCKAWLGRA